MRSGPTPIHRLEPPATTPMPGHEHGHEQAQGHQRQHDPQPAPPVVADADRADRRRWRRAPSTGPGARRWSTPTRSNCSDVYAEADSTMTSPMPHSATTTHERRRCASRRGRGARSPAPAPACDRRRRRRSRRLRRRRPVTAWPRRRRRRGAGAHRRRLAGPAGVNPGRAPHAPGEVVAPVGVGPVPVERRARRRQHHGVARPGHGRGAVAPPRPWTAPAPRAPRPAKASTTSSAASPMATTPRRRGAGRAQHRQVEALVAAPGDQHGRSEPCHGGQHGTGRGRLGVVVEPHPASLAHQLDPVGEPPEGDQGRAGSASALAPAATAVASGARAFDQSWGMRPGELARPAPRRPRRGPPSAPPSHRVVARREAEGAHRGTPAPRHGSRAAMTTGSSALATATSPGPLLAHSRALAPR